MSKLELRRVEGNGANSLIDSKVGNNYHKNRDRGARGFKMILRDAIKSLIEREVKITDYKPEDLGRWN